MHTLVKVNHMIKDHLSLCVKLLNYQSWPIEAREEEQRETVNNYKNWREQAQVIDVKWWRVHDWEWKRGACRTNVECAIQQTEPATKTRFHAHQF